MLRVSVKFFPHHYAPILQKLCSSDQRYRLNIFSNYVFDVDENSKQGVPNCWVFVEFFHVPIPRKGSDSTTTPEQ